MTRAWLALAAACGAPAPARPASPGAALSLAADAHMLAIPAGKFVAGSTPEEREAAYRDLAASSNIDTALQRRWFDAEEDRHMTYLPAFRIDLMPVTQAQYAEFVAAGQAPPPAIDAAGWAAQGEPEDYATVERYVWRDGRPPAGREEHPVVLVSYREAARYCAWRGEQRGAPRRLPTAAEYEKAARGDGGVAYPWGNEFEADKLDSAVAGPHDTAPVGSYVAGASPYGALDMAGNVLEWTSTPYRAGEMTVKGSAWTDFAGVGRGASRHGRAIDSRHLAVGFRCAADR
ncbi:MAG TPA: SUMF1/EgtB/PvdO family nonheme iron enzyme [Kofleriaceae bacterium]|nr:SUMF1/EgtB/PvdO family nonheme iron enzyme [Kofleriaceae bacterium]